jgi:tetratricopeptide (TPR) repeat protein
LKKPVPKRPSQPARHRKNSGAFLLSETDAQPRTAVVADGPLTAAAEVLAAFPHLLTGSSFLTHALEQLETEAEFSALVIQMDTLPAGNNSTSRSDYVHLQLQIAKIIDAFCQNAKGVWGQVNQVLFGCFFASCKPPEGLHAANKLREEIRHKTGAPVSIGIATYPQLDYAKGRIIENAHKALRHATFFGPGTCTVFDAVSLNISGDEKYQSGDIEGAVQEFEMGLRLDPSNVNLHNSLGVCFGVLKQYDKAWAAFDAALSLDSREVMALYNAGQVRFMQKRYDEALNYFLQAVDLAEDLYEVAFQIGKLYLQMQNPQQSRPYLEQAAHLNPSLGPPFALLGQCYHDLKMPNQAIAAFKKAIRRNPFDAESLSSLGLLYSEKGENADIATLFCQKSIDIEPENARFYFRLGRLHLKYDRLDEARDAFQEASARGWDATEDIQKIQNQLTVKAS